MAFDIGASNYHIDRCMTHGSISPKRPRPQLLLRRIHHLAADSANVILSNHAIDRMAERDIIDVEVFRILRNGALSGEPEQTPKGEWKLKLVMRLRGNRDAGVVTIILHGNRKLLVKTVEWEDLK